MDAGIGDKGRLEHIISTIKGGKTLYKSDQNYLDEILKKHGEKTTQLEPKKETESKSPVHFNQNSSIYNPKKQSKPQELGEIYYITHNTSSGSVKIHHRSCWHVQRASYTSSTKWDSEYGYQNAKSHAEMMARRQRTYWKHAECCLNGIINRSVSSALFLALIPFLGLVSSLIVREYYPTFAKGLKYFGLAYGVLVTIFYFANR